MFKCNFCQHKFSGTGTTAASHLAGGGVGVRACTVVPNSVRVVCKNTNGDCVESVCSDSDLKPKAAVQTKMDAFGFGFFRTACPLLLHEWSLLRLFRIPTFQRILSSVKRGLSSSQSKSTFNLAAQCWKRKHQPMEGRFAFPKTFICLTNTDTALVNLINFEALTRFGPISVATIQRILYCLENQRLCSSAWWHWKKLRTIHLWLKRKLQWKKCWG